MVQGSIIRVSQGDARSLDYSSHDAGTLLQSPQEFLLTFILVEPLGVVMEYRNGIFYIGLLGIPFHMYYGRTPKVLKEAF